MSKKSFWQKIIGTVPENEEVLYEEYDMTDYNSREEDEETTSQEHEFIENTSVQELPVDVYQTEDDIIIEAFIAGMPLDELNIELARDSITINGNRKSNTTDEEFFLQELNWGEFERIISLPEEVDIDAAEATEVSGVLKIVLPKFNKSRKAKLHVKSIK